jgi:NADPH:quinone reductase-like Zn-dependent oxidoreductase
MAEARTTPLARTPGLLGQTVVISGVSCDIGLAVARRTKTEGARLILTDRRAGRLEELADEIGVEATAAFDGQNAEQIEAFLVGLPPPVDHIVLIEGSLQVARCAGRQPPAGGSLLFIQRALCPDPGRAASAISLAALLSLIAKLALEIAPVRINLIIADDSPEDVAAVAVHLMTDPALTGGLHHLGSPA